MAGKRKHPEDLEQIALFEMIEWHAPRFPVLELAYHPANGGKRSRAEASILKAMGVNAGIPDVVLPAARRGYIGLYIEMKAPGKIKATTPEQEAKLKRLCEEGHLSVVADSGAAAWELMRWYVEGSCHFDGEEKVPAALAQRLRVFVWLES